MFNIDYDNPNVIENVTVYDPRDDEKSLVLPINLAAEDLDTFCAYVINLSDTVSHAALINAKTMFEMLDRKPYFNNDALKARLEFITLALEARVDNNLSSKNLIKSHVLRNCDVHYKDFIENELIPSIPKISESTCKYLNGMVFENLIEGYSLTYSQKLMNIFDKKSAGGYKRISDFSKDLKKLITDMNIQICKSEEYMREGKGFDLTSGNIKHEIQSILKELRAPTNKLKTGLQYLNRMLNGGFESGRSYLFMGVTGVGKSIILLSTAMWIRKYNKLPIIDGMKQAVLFISQENSKSETFERMFNISVSGEDIRSFTDDDIENGLKNVGLIEEDDANDSGINFIFRYFDDKEIGVADIDAMISDFERKNIQIICVVQDYIEKLKPKHTYTEMRHSLGSVATEMSELAKKRHIPFISAAQLNRMASSVVDNAVASNKTNTTKLLGKQNVSESWDMMKNVDAAIIINREIDDTQQVEKQYMGFKLEKFRGKPSKDKLYVFLHPFDENNPILLTPDMDLAQPMSRLRMEDFNPFNDKSVTIKNKPDFKTYEDDASDDFMTGLMDMIDDNYSDSSKNYVELYKNAEAATNKIALLQQHDSDLRERRLAELRELLKTPDSNALKVRQQDGYYHIKPRVHKYSKTKDGLIIVHRRNKVE